MVFANVNAIDPIVKALGDNGYILSDINVWSILIRLLLALLFGGLLGVERAMKRKTAGFRTYMLVVLGACIAGILDQFLAQTLTSDGSRIIAGVVTGIGFLGVGTIVFTSRSKVHGLTTAAGLWAIGCVGIAIGAGLYTVGLIGGVLCFITVSVAGPIEYHFLNKGRNFTLEVELTSSESLKTLIDILRDRGFKIHSVEHNEAYSGTGLSVYVLGVEANLSKDKNFTTQSDLCNEINSFKYVHHCEVIR